MPSLLNRTVLPAMRFGNSDAQGRQFGVVMVKAAFDIEPDGTCRLASEQEPFNFTDVPHEGLNASSLKYPSDLVAYKPATDVVVDATAHAPGGIAAPEWEAGLSVRDAHDQCVSHHVRVLGTRSWLPKWRQKLTTEEAKRWRDVRKAFAGWTLSAPEPILALSLRYEYAFGGSIPRGEDDEGKPIVAAHHRNPVGRGWIDEHWTDHTQPVPAPQIEPLAEAVTTPGQEYRPAGLGPIPPAWLPRRPYGGTFDDEWRQSVWPAWPADYDFCYNNCAVESLQHTPHLRGALAIDLHNLRAGASDFTLAVPDQTPIIGVTTSDGAKTLVEPRLDTVVLDIAADDLFQCRVLLTWRAPFNRSTTNELVVLMPAKEEREAFAERIALSEPPDRHATPYPELERLR